MGALQGSELVVDNSRCEQKAMPPQHAYTTVTSHYVDYQLLDALLFQDILMACLAIEQPPCLTKISTHHDALLVNQSTRLRKRTSCSSAHEIFDDAL